jgi:hypothetical protein
MSDCYVSPDDKQIVSTSLLPFCPKGWKEANSDRAEEILTTMNKRFNSDVVR